MDGGKDPRVFNWTSCEPSSSSWLFVLDRLQNSEQERKQSDQSDKDMKKELEGKVDALQKQLADLDTLRSTGNQ